MTRKNLLLSLALTLAVGSCTFSATIALSRAGTLVKTDGLAYFLYARSAVIDFDTDITNEFETLDRRIPEGYDNMMVALRKHGKRHPETGKIVVPWPVGSGLVMVPFYALGWWAELTVSTLQGRPADSYGLIPQFFYGTGSLVYGWLAFWGTWWCCRRVVGAQRIAGLPIAATAPLVMFATGSTVFYLFISPSMAHGASVGLVALLLCLWWRHWDGESRGLVLPGLLLGSMMTVRYQNTMFFPLLVASVLREWHRSSFREAARQAVTGVLATLVPLTVQVVHYLAMHGTSRSEIDVGSGGLALEQNQVSPLSPGFFDVLFSCLHGALYWTPIVAVGLAGLFWAARSASWARVFLLTFTVHVYLIGALADGTAGHAFGMRYLIENSPLLAVGLAFLLQRAAASRGATRGLLALLVLLGLWNGLLILAFGTGTISGTHCVTHAEMVRGVGETLTRLGGGG